MAGIKVNEKKGGKLHLKKRSFSSQLPDSEDQFERDWQNAISGDEFVKRVHQHIDELYARK